MAWQQQENTPPDSTDADRITALEESIRKGMSL